MLLHVLHEFLPFLPKDSRTLLKTMRFVSTRDVLPGKYYHFGIQSGCLKALSAMESTSDNVTVFVNVDGVPLTKSTNNQFWPIVGRIVKPVCSSPFTIGIYHGAKDPKSFNDFLDDFVTESLTLKEEGFFHMGIETKVKIGGFICDAPARAKLCFTLSHNSYYGCSKCFTMGEYFRVPGSNGGRVVFPELNAKLRTNENFRNRQQPEHHQPVRSRLEDLEIDMVRDFPDEEMHLLDIGCMKKMLYFMTSIKGMTFKFYRTHPNCVVSVSFAIMNCYFYSVNFSRVIQIRIGDILCLERPLSLLLNQFFCETKFVSKIVTSYRWHLRLCADTINSGGY